jgi:hypothetical protein
MKRDDDLPRQARDKRKETSTDRKKAAKTEKKLV